jgi:hypothetical protein
MFDQRLKHAILLADPPDICGANITLRMALFGHACMYQGRLCMQGI